MLQKKISRYPQQSAPNHPHRHIYSTRTFFLLATRNPEQLLSIQFAMHTLLDLIWPFSSSSSLTRHRYRLALNEKISSHYVKTNDAMSSVDEIIHFWHFFACYRAIASHVLKFSSNVSFGSIKRKGKRRGKKNTQQPAVI